MFVLTAGPVDLTITFLSPVEVGREFFRRPHDTGSIQDALDLRPCEPVAPFLVLCRLRGGQRRQVP